MLNGKTFLGIVPARKKSKGLPNKNIKSFLGKPLIAWPIHAAQRSGIFDKIMVYSDSDEIGRIGFIYGASFVKEPDELAADGVYITIAIADLLKRMEAKGVRYDYVQLLQPTNPGVHPDQIKGAANLLLGLYPFDKSNRGDVDMVVSVHQYKDPTIVVKEIPYDLSLKDWYPEEFKGKTRQQFPPAYRLNGHIYLAKWEVWRDQLDWWKQNIYAYICLPEDDIDIDTKWDWEWAELKMKKMKGIK